MTTGHAEARDRLIETIAWAISVTRRRDLNDKDRQQMAEALVDRLDAYLKAPMEHEGDSYAPNTTVEISDGEGPYVCPGCGAPGFFGERPSEADRERARRTKEDPRALHWEVRGARVCLECWNKEKGMAILQGKAR